MWRFIKALIAINVRYWLVLLKGFPTIVNMLLIRKMVSVLNKIALILVIFWNFFGESNVIIKSDNDETKVSAVNSYVSFMNDNGRLTNRTLYLQNVFPLRIICNPKNATIIIDKEKTQYVSDVKLVYQTDRDSKNVWRTIFTPTQFVSLAKIRSYQLSKQHNKFVLLNDTVTYTFMAIGNTTFIDSSFPVKKYQQRIR